MASIELQFYGGAVLIYMRFLVMHTTKSFENANISLHSPGQLLFST